MSITLTRWNRKERKAEDQIGFNPDDIKSVVGRQWEGPDGPFDGSVVTTTKHGQDYAFNIKEPEVEVRRMMAEANVAAVETASAAPVLTPDDPISTGPDDDFDPTANNPVLPDDD